MTLADDRKFLHVPAGITPAQVIESESLRFVRPYFLLVNGEAISKTEYDTFVLKENDVCHFVELPGAAGFAAFTSWIYGYLAGYTGLTLGQAAAVAGAIGKGVALVAAIGVGMLANRFLGQSPGAPGSIGAQETVYSITSDTNRLAIGSPFPESFGQMRIYPEYAAAPYVVYNALNTFEPASDQYLYFMGVIGVGSYQIDSVMIGDTPVADLTEVTYNVIDPGEIPTIYDRIVYSNNNLSGQPLSYVWDPVTYYPLTTIVNPSGTTITDIGWDIEFPGGCYAFDKRGMRPAHFILIVYARTVNDSGEATSEWVALTVKTDPAIENGELFTLCGNQVMRASFYKAAPFGAARYELRVWAVAPDTNVNVVTNKAFMGQVRGYGGTYPLTRADFCVPADVTLLEMRVKASVQLTGALSNKINVIATRKLYPVTATGFGGTLTATSSIADFCAYVVTSDNGGKQEDSVIDWDDLYAVDQEMTTLGYYFNHRFQTRCSVMEACTTAAKCGRAVPYMPGLFTIIQDKEQSTYTAKYTVKDYDQGSFSMVHSFFTADSPTGVEIHCIDSATWSGAVLECPDGDAGENPSVVELVGCTSKQQGFEIGSYLWLDNLNNRSVISFRTGLKGHLPLPGSKVLVEVPSADGSQYSGVIQKIDGTNIHLSEAADFNGEASASLYISAAGAAVAGPYTVTAGASSHIVVGTLPEATATVATAQNAAVRYIFAPTAADLVEMRVTKIVPSGQNSIQVEGTIYGTLAYVHPGSVPSVSDSWDLLESVSLRYKGVVSDAYSYVVGWLGSTDSVQIEVDEGSGYEILEDDFTTSSKAFTVSDALTISVKVTPYDSGGLVTEDAQIVTYTVPAPVTGLVAVGEVTDAWEIAWDADSSADSFAIWIEVGGVVIATMYSETSSFSRTADQTGQLGGPWAEWTVYVAAQNGSDRGKAASLTLNCTVVPSALTATGKPYAILLEFSYLPPNNFEALEIWASEENDRSTALKIGETGGTAYLHAGLEIGDEYYYWIRWRTTSDNYSTWYPEGATAGVYGMVSNSAEDYLALLTGQITEAELFSGLRHRIDLVDKDWMYAPGYAQEGYFHSMKTTEEDHQAYIVDLVATVDDPETGVLATASATSSLSAEVEDIDGTLTAVVQNTNTLTATVYDPDTGLEAAFGEISENAEVIATLDGNVRAEYSLWLNANGHITGFRTMVDHTGSSEFDIVSDRFRIINKNDSGDFVVPFAVGSLATGGTGVGIDGDLFITGSIVGPAFDGTSTWTITSGGNIKIQSGANLEIETGGNLEVESGGNLNIQSGANLNIKSGGDLTIFSGATVSITAAATISLTAGGSLSLSGAEISISTGSSIKIYGTSGNPAYLRFYDSASTLVGQIGATTANEVLFYPAADSTYKLNLGQSAGWTVYWAEINFNADQIYSRGSIGMLSGKAVDFYNTSNTKLSGIYAAGDYTYWLPTYGTRYLYLGTTSYEWDILHLNATYLNFTGTTTLTGSIFPEAGNTRDIGNSIYYFRYLYANWHYYKNTAAFDDYDDLELISMTSVKEDKSLDLSALPDKFFSREKDGSVNRDFVNSGMMHSLLLGASKQTKNTFDQDMNEYNAMFEEVIARLTKLEKAVLS